MALNSEVCYAECGCAAFYYAECHYAECRFFRMSIFWRAECLYVYCRRTLFKPGPAVRNNNAKGCIVFNQEKCIFIQNCLNYFTVGSYTMIIFKRTKTLRAII